MKNFKDFFKISTILAAFLFGTLSAAPASATPLNLTLLDFPDITAGYINVTYDSGTDIFKAIGLALTLDDDGIGQPENISYTDWNYNITATIDELGNASSGSLSISGTIPTLGFNSGTLLTGNLTDFGYRDEGGDPLEFLFDVTGGDLSDLFGSVAGTILSFTGFGGSFAENFQNDAYAGVNDTGAMIPEPATMFLLGSGLIGLAGYRRKIKK